MPLFHCTTAAGRYLPAAPVHSHSAGFPAINHWLCQSPVTLLLESCPYLYSSESDPSTQAATYTGLWLPGPHIVLSSLSGSLGSQSTPPRSHIVKGRSAPSPGGTRTERGRHRSSSAAKARSRSTSRQHVRALRQAVICSQGAVPQQQPERPKWPTVPSLSSGTASCHFCFLFFTALPFTSPGIDRAPSLTTG